MQTAETELGSNVVYVFFNLFCKLYSFVAPTS